MIHSWQQFERHKRNAKLLVPVIKCDERDLLEPDLPLHEFQWPNQIVFRGYYTMYTSSSSLDPFARISVAQSNSFQRTLHYVYITLCTPLHRG